MSKTLMRHFLNLGSSDTFHRAVASFAKAYANQNERDYAAFLGAIEGGRIIAASSGT